MNIFLDANILVSVLNKEYPSFAYSARILSLSNSHRFQFYTSSICLAIAFYFSEKKSGSRIANKKIEILTSHLLVAGNRKEDVFMVLKNKKIQDFEDGLEYYAALDSKCKCIVTEDVNDFYFSEIEVLKPKDFLLRYSG